MSTATKECFITPRVNIVEDDQNVQIEAELPGVTKTGLEIEVCDGELTLKGHRQVRTNNGALRLAERADAGYWRVFTLGKGVQPDKITAEMNDGILKLTVPKAEHVKPRVINVN
ncbi:MAG: Hsp20/alpha crystallin family protein [Candidatus Hydrogenedentota bacterium]